MFTERWVRGLSQSPIPPPGNAPSGPLLTQLGPVDEVPFMERRLARAEKMESGWADR